MIELREDLELTIAEMEREIAEPVAAAAPRRDAPIVIESEAPARARRGGLRRVKGPEEDRGGVSDIRPRFGERG